MCLGGNPICTCEDRIAPECWAYHLEQEARKIEREIFEATGEEVTAEIIAWAVLNGDDGGDAA